MEKRNYSQDIANAIRTFLNEDDWHFSFDEQTGMFRFGLTLKCKLNKVNYRIDVEDDSYIVYATSPLGADADDEKMMAAMAEFVCRANYGLTNGNFEFDMRDGEIRFKCYVDCDDIMPTTQIIRNSIYRPGVVFKRYGPGIVDVIFGNATAKDAVARCERPKNVESIPTSVLSAIAEGGDTSELRDMLARLLGTGASSDEAPGSTDEEPAHIKTDLFGQGGEA